jgi:hypothetical protein
MQEVIKEHSIGGIGHQVGLAEGVNKCCEQTLETHAANNPMMVCGACKQIIKCFSDEKSYRNFLTFCKSRHRETQYFYYDPYYVVIYRAYQSSKVTF